MAGAAGEGSSVWDLVGRRGLLVGGEPSTLCVVYFVSVFCFLLLPVYNTHLTIEMNCILNHAVKYFPLLLGSSF